MKIYFLIPGNINSLTGGHLYNKHLIAGLKQQGREVHILSIPGPLNDPGNIEKSCRIHFRKLIPGSVIIIDSLAIGLMGKVIREFNRYLQFIGLIHLPATFNIISDGSDSLLKDYEVEAMNNASLLIVTGIYMVHLLERAGIRKDKIRIVEPGVESFPRKKHYAKIPSRLLCISNYSPFKAQHLLIGGLESLRMKTWTLKFFGNMDTESNYVQELKDQIDREKLADRILLADTLPRKDLTGKFLEADLFVLPSLFESYGMVLAESLAHGIPVITTTAGNIPYTVPAGMGILTQPGNKVELISALNDLFSNPEKYRSLCESAANYYKQCRSWKTSVLELEGIIFEKAEMKPYFGP